MGALKGKQVSLDLDALQKVCQECLEGIEAMEDREIQAAMRQVCGHCMAVQRQLPALQEMRQCCMVEGISSRG